MPYLIAIILITAIVVLGWLWRMHKRAYYELEESVENRLGPVRGYLDGVGEYSVTSSGLIPHLNKIANKFGDRLSSEEAALMRKSRACYYIGGVGGLFTIAAILGVVIALS